METGPTTFIVAPGICYSPATEDGCIILDLNRDSILSLNSTGALIFSKLAASERGMTQRELVDAALHEFDDVEPARIESAVERVLSQLMEKDVVGSNTRGVRSYATWLRSKLTHVAIVGLRGLVKPLLFAKAYTTAALLMLTTADALLKFGGFGTLHLTVREWKLRRNGASDAEAVAESCATVDRACVWHPKQKLCLQRSAVATWLLRSLGVPAEMVIGVHKMPFYGHCWVEVDGRVVNDHKNVQSFFHVLSRC